MKVDALYFKQVKADNRFLLHTQHAFLNITNNITAPHLGEKHPYIHQIVNVIGYGMLTVMPTLPSVHTLTGYNSRLQVFCFESGKISLICDIVCSAKRDQKVNVYLQHRTVSGFTFRS